MPNIFTFTFCISKYVAQNQSHAIDLFLFCKIPNLITHFEYAFFNELQNRI